MRQAADELRAEPAGDTVTFVVNRNINISNICVVGCAFCGFGQGRRSPDAYEHSEAEFCTRARGGRVRSHRDLHAVGHPPGLDDRRLRALAARGQGRGAADSPARLLADGGRRDGRRPAVVRGVRAAARGRPRLRRPAPRRRCSGRRRARADLPEQAARGALGRGGSRPCHGAGVRSTGTVMFGHIEEPGSWPSTCVVRSLQERTGGFTEFVPLVPGPVPHDAGPHARDRLDLAEENLKHTAAFRLALGKTISSLQASWVKMGLDAATESLRWGSTTSAGR